MSLISVVSFFYEIAEKCERNTKPISRLTEARRTHGLVVYVDMSIETRQGHGCVHCTPVFIVHDSTQSW